MPKAVNPKTNRAARVKSSKPYETRGAEMIMENGTVRSSRENGRVDQYFLSNAEAQSCLPLIEGGVGVGYEKTPATFLYSMATVASRHAFRKLLLQKKKGKSLNVPFTLQVLKVVGKLAEGFKKNMM